MHDECYIKCFLKLMSTVLDKKCINQMLSNIIIKNDDDNKDIENLKNYIMNDDIHKLKQLLCILTKQPKWVIEYANPTSFLNEIKDLFCLSKGIITCNLLDTDNSMIIVTEKPSVTDYAFICDDDILCTNRNNYVYINRDDFLDLKISSYYFFPRKNKLLIVHINRDSVEQESFINKLVVPKERLYQELNLVGIIVQLDNGTSEKYSFYVKRNNGWNFYNSKGNTYSFVGTDLDEYIFRNCIDLVYI